MATLSRAWNSCDLCPKEEVAVATVRLAVGARKARDIDVCEKHREQWDRVEAKWGHVGRIVR